MLSHTDHLLQELYEFEVAAAYLGYFVWVLGVGVFLT